MQQQGIRLSDPNLFCAWYFPSKPPVEKTSKTRNGAHLQALAQTRQKQPLKQRTVAPAKLSTSNQPPLPAQLGLALHRKLLCDKTPSASRARPPVRRIQRISYSVRTYPPSISRAPNPGSTPCIALCRGSTGFRTQARFIIPYPSRHFPNRRDVTLKPRLLRSSFSKPRRELYAPAA